MILYPGSSTNIDRDFDPSDNSVTVAAIDYNGLSIPVTTATKIDGNTWRTTLTIPEVAPVCSPTSGYYKLIWTFDDGDKTLEQEFQVIAYDEGVQRPPPAGFGVVGVSLTDEVYLPYGATSITCEILNLQGGVVIAHDNANVSTDNVTTQTPNSPGSVKASLEVTLPVASVGEYMAHWRYVVGSTPLHEYRQVFLVSIKTAQLISSVRMYLDQSVQARWLGHLQFTDVELVDCLYRAADRINAHPPQQTAYSPDTFPNEYAYAIRQCTLHEMLNRLYLAEGMSTFDFQGGSIQVSTERTQYFQTKMEEILNWIDTYLRDIKQAMQSRRSIGHLHVSVSQGGVNNNYRHGSGYVRPNEFMLTRNNMLGLLG